MIMQKDFDAKPEIRALPKAVQRKLDSFIFKEIPKVPFFKPDGKPKKEWKMFYGDTWDAARGAAWDAARDAARDAAWDAAWDAARDAARGAALISDYLITSDLDFKDKAKHLAHAKARWEVWQKGYGLLCDVDGVLYVYCKGKPQPAKPLTDKEAKEKLDSFEKRIAELEASAKADKDKLDRIKAILG